MTTGPEPAESIPTTCRFPWSTRVAPFQVTSPNSSSVAWSAGNSETVTWNVAGTSGGTINTPLVNILLSTDGGLTFPTVLASNVPNDGSHDIAVPNLPTTQARFMVEGVGNIFFDVSNFNFRIAEVDNTPPDASATTFDVTSAGGTTYSFTVTYTDNVAVDSSDIGNGDVEIIAPDLSVIPAVVRLARARRWTHRPSRPPT